MPKPVQIITPRKLEILKLMAGGLSTKEIAMQLNLSIATIDTHRYQMMGALNIHTGAGLVGYAYRNRLLTPEEGQ